MTMDIMDKVFDRIHEQTIDYIKRSKSCGQKPTRESIEKTRSVISNIKLQADGIRKGKNAKCFF